jgi:hypothetical protein
MEKDKTIHLYSEGIIAASICVHKDMTREEIVEQVNIQHPTNISTGWKISDDKTFKQGKPNPCECEQDSDRLHYLLEC